MRNRWRITIILLLAAALRLALAAQDLVVYPDGATYLMLARKFAMGDWRGGFSPLWPPLYPLATSLLTRVISDVDVAGRLVSAVSGVACVALLYRFYRQCYDETTAFTGALLAALFVHFINFSALAMTESLYLALLVAALATGWTGLRDNSPKLLFLTGLLFGLCYLTRPEAFCYILLWAVFALSGWFASARLAWRDAGWGVPLLSEVT